MFASGSKNSYGQKSFPLSPLRKRVRARGQRKELFKLMSIMISSLRPLFL